MYENLIILDRNIVSIINDYLMGHIKNDPRKTKIIEELKQYDTDQNLFSTVFSTIEGSKGNQESKAQKVQTFIKESNILNNFLQYAESEAKLINSPEKYIIYGEHLSGSRNWKEEKYFSSFLKEISPCIAQPISPKNRFIKIKEICLLARQFGVSLNNPLGFSIVLTIFGDDKSRRIIKPKMDISKCDDNWAYNILSDFFSIRLIYETRKYLEKKLFKNTVFITSDIGLRDYLERIELIIPYSEIPPPKKIIYDPIQFSISFKNLPLSERECVNLAEALNYIQINSGFD